MAIEPNIDPPGTGYINDLDSSNPDGAVSEVRELDNHTRGIKNVLLRTFAMITGAVTASHTELNKLTGIVAGTVSAGLAVVVDSSKNIGTFATVTATTFVGNLTGNADTATNATVAASCTGNAATATSAAAWTTGRTITLTGDVTGVSGAWTGSGNISFATNIASSIVRFSYEMDGTILDSSIVNITNSAPKPVPVGVVNLGLVSVAACKLQTFDGVAWADASEVISVSSSFGQQIVSDGVSVRIIGLTGSPSAVRYRRIFA